MIGSIEKNEETDAIFSTCPVFSEIFLEGPTFCNDLIFFTNVTFIRKESDFFVIRSIEAPI